MVFGQIALFSAVATAASLQLRSSTMEPAARDIARVRMANKKKHKSDKAKSAQKNKIDPSELKVQAGYIGPNWCRPLVKYRGIWPDEQKYGYDVIPGPSASKAIKMAPPNGGPPYYAKTGGMKDMLIKDGWTQKNKRDTNAKLIGDSWKISWAAWPWN